MSTAPSCSTRADTLLRRVRRCAAPSAGLRCAEGVPSGDMVAKLREAGLLSIGAGENVVRLAPPLTIQRSEVDYACEILSSVLT